MGDSRWTVVVRPRHMRTYLRHASGSLLMTGSDTLPDSGMEINGIKVNMLPTKPGDFVRSEILEELGLSVTKTAGILGVRRATLSALLNSNAALSAEMALRIEKAFGVSMDLLLRMQAWHDASRMRARAGEIEVQPYDPQST